MSTTPSNWLRQVESIVVHSKDIPMWGSFPAFPWEKFSKGLTESLGLKKLKISSGNAEWKKGASILTGMGRSPLHLGIEFSPLKGSISLVFPSEDFSKLSSKVIHPKAADKGFSDPYLQKGFFRYLTLESMRILDQTEIFKGLTPKLIEMPLAKEDAYCIDVAIELDEETIWGRVICPTLFQEAFKEHFSDEWRLTIPSHLYEEIFLDLHLYAGETTLSQDAWKKLNAGDFVLLDHCSYYPNVKKGTFQLTFNHTPLFQVKLREENIKVLDYALYNEENPMADETPDDIFEPSAGDSSAGVEAETGGEETSVPAEASPSEDLISPKKVPLSLSIEVGKMNMSLDKLLKLKPGNVIDLAVQPELGVSLVANGRPVARGHLIQVGDVVGVKITEIGT